MIRVATMNDYPQLHRIRIAVKENRLSDPSRITRQDYESFLSQKGRGWVHTIHSIITGFVIIDLEDHNIWALFVDPVYEGRGIGRQLHDTMLNWYFGEYQATLWLSTSPGTKAEAFYRRAGWVNKGLQTSGEVRFEMPFQNWQLNTR